MFWCAYGSLRLVNGISGGQRGFSGVSRSVPDLYQGAMEVSEAFQDHLEGSGASQEIPKDFRRFPGMCQGSSGFFMLQGVPECLCKSQVGQEHFKRSVELSGGI